MSKCNSNLPRAIAVADFILEDNGHTIIEAAKEFNCSKTTIQRDLNFLGSYLYFYYNEEDINIKKLKIKYIKVKRVLNR